MNVNFLTTTNNYNGYGMTREYFKKYLPKFGIILDPANSGNPIDFILHIPPAISHSKAPIKVLYTMLEGDIVPDSWYKHLSQATHIIVPSHFVQDTFKRAGFESTVIPLGYDPDMFYDAGPRNNDIFTFLHYEAFQDRKGWKDVFTAWDLSGLAQEETTAQLILKTIRPYKEVYERLHGEDHDTFVSYNTKIIIGELPHRTIFELLAKSDCFVFPSHGEGFSLPPIEAMATGCPVIVSKGHSHMDYFNPDIMYGVDANIRIPAKYENWENQGYFVRCNVDELATVMRYAYENKQETGKRGRGSVEYAKRYVYDKAALKLSEFLCRLQEQ